MQKCKYLRSFMPVSYLIGMVFKSEDIRNGLVGHFALYDVQTLGQGGIVLASLLPTLVGQSDGIA